MSRRENRGQQAALIIFAILNATLAVTTFWFYRQYQYEKKLALAAAQSATQQERMLHEAQLEIDQLKGIVGHDPIIHLDDIHATHRTDSGRIAVGPGEAVLRPYRALVETLWLTARGLVSRELAARQREQHLADTLSGVEENHRLATSKYAASEKVLDERLRTERDAFAVDRLRHEKHTVELGKLADTRARESLHWQDSFRTMRDQLTRQIASLNRDYETVVAEVRKFEKVTFEKPDGQVTSSDGRTRHVFVDLGSEDRLRVGLAFSVFPPRSHGGLGDKSKGSIEIVDILGPHSAEARIVSDRLKDPIIAGDIIYSPLWHPGKQRHFALIGPLDVDGNGSDDRPWVLSIIEQAGGVVDEELETSGARSGKMTLDTRFLVIGRIPNERNASADFLEDYSQMIERAKHLAIETISLEKLLDLTGHRKPTSSTAQPTPSARQTRTR